jgi:simple sugar transport system permease protein
MQNKIKNFFITNYIELSVGFALFLLVFILPQFFIGNDAMLLVIRGLIVGAGFGYILYKFLLFRRENPDFKPSESKLLVDVAGSIIAILTGLLFGLILMLIVNPGQAFGGFFVILQGGFRNIKSFGDMVYFSVPIILTGLSVAFAFRTGLFNIGATGQLTMGAYAAVFIGVKWVGLGEFSPFLHWIAAILGAMIAGALWGSIPGLLKAYRNVNEVVSSIMLNYVAMYLNTMLIVKYIYNRDYARALAPELSSVTPLMNLQHLFPGSSISGGIVVAVIVVIILHIILNKTTFGYELKAVGFNRDASKYAGMNSKRNIVYAMVISGAVAGLAGGLMYLVDGKFLQPLNVLIPEGFTGIAISLLGLSSPFGVLLAGLFYGSLKQGGFYLQLYSFTPEIIDIIIAVIIYASALGLFLQKFVIRAMKKREMQLDNLPEEPVEGSES